MQGLPEWAKLVRLSSDEISLVAFFRACSPEVQGTIHEFCRLSAEACNHPSHTVVDNVVFLASKVIA